ncbi:MAG: hypothetical protein ACK559_29895, partial [bacterium]
LHVRHDVGGEVLDHGKPPDLRGFRGRPAGDEDRARREPVAGHDRLAGALVDPLPVDGDLVEGLLGQAGAAALGELAHLPPPHRAAQHRVGPGLRGDPVRGHRLDLLDEG